MQLRFLGAAPGLFKRCCFHLDQNPVEARAVEESEENSYSFDEASFKITKALFSLASRLCTAKNNGEDPLLSEGISGNVALFPLSTLVLACSASTIGFLPPRKESNSLKLPPRSRCHKSTPWVKGGLMGPGELLWGEPRWWKRRRWERWWMRTSR